MRFYQGPYKSGISPHLGFVHNRVNECPLSLECKLVDIVQSGLNEIFIGEIFGTYTEECFLSEGKLDFQKMKPLILSQANTTYWGLGEPLAMAWNIGKRYKKKRK